MGKTRKSRRGGGGAEAVVEAVDGGLAQLMPDPERARAWTLLIDGAPQSHVDLDDPSHLSFEYQRRLGHVIDLVAPAGKPVHAVHLGGGALTLARYVAATRPRSTQQVVERDAALVQLVRRELPLDPNARIRVRSVDAREGLAKVLDGWADLVVADVFSGARTPAHLTSAEFLDEVRRALKPGGVYAANIADGPPLAHLRGQIATAAARFPELALLADPTVLRGKRFGNAVLVASDAPLPIAELTRGAASDPHPGRVEHGRALVDFTGGAAPVTDAAAVASPAPPPSVFR
ncbi:MULTISPECIES: spermidine synthase [unclassified Streptomyces]|uniref:spermidine synthase n=1 Tax=unclassified Streptomyces TaxID=2593676 RepID=UPI002259CD81|nr:MULTISPECIES: fused MFS/spermidine synthase [unclassified Streptomyces]MCX4881003.1 fused MFS/spermidine synthase [Streptomyces sp. NBC_00847]MCX5048403.1 fused MFS/spermidine synthase [Streptomyces sp. NBC_00474]MCX5056862.1 fused MFS/spermidine synthase [Streptomyces sp. NBC_00452]MCX5246221.1 fused MFS/spermidine synthase [Streptomyces sp. NBC_00201]MCX5287954.1 fused MFS/spermidine synthase [Streptomyces sp. NBC_00183]